ncbi:MAG: histidinol-phosphatase HisJ family protein, partial [Spirochaetaceae bacterium]|nr:histidinol-phosphatase HisJ family protein [Spirochaetaceae bacterium]
MIKFNLHTHTIYSDGKNTPEEMINRAIELNFSDLGFSEHADDVCSEDGIVMLQKDYIKYFNLLDTLKEKYKSQINIYKGLELDAFSYTPKVKLDYTIGSIHYIKKNNEFYSIDFDAETSRKIVDIFGGTKNLLIAYLEEMIAFAKRNPYNILAHFDLYTKFNEIDPIFDVNSKEYLDMATNALEEVINLGKIIEINTGAISRGYRTTFYPSLSLVKVLNDLKAPIILGSDAHSK